MTSSQRPFCFISRDSQCNRHVRFTPESGHDGAAIELSAKGQKRVQLSFSITDRRARKCQRHQFASKTGMVAFAIMCWVAPPNIICRSRLCV